MLKLIENFIMKLLTLLRANGMLFGNKFLSVILISLFSYILIYLVIL